MQHDFRTNTLREMESGRCRKYQRFYQRQRLAFAPMVTNALWHCEPDLLQSLWNLADHYAQTCEIFSGSWWKYSSAFFSVYPARLSKQQTILNPEAKIQRKWSRNFDMYLRRHNHSYLWNYFQLDLFPTVHQMVWAASTQVVSQYSQIWHVSGLFSRKITIFSIQQFNAHPPQPHNRCSF